MKVKSYARITLLAGAMALAAPVFAAEPTVKEVYAAAQAGNYVEAQAMMDQVLKAHPNSASAHFVEAELLAKQGKFKAAEVSLAKAEELAPGLPKVNPTSVAKLRTLLAEGQKPRADYSQRQPARSSNGGGYANNAGTSAGGGIPWGTILIVGGGLLGFIWLATRFMQRRAQQSGGGFDPAGYNAGAPQPGYPPGGYPQQGGFPQQGYPQPGYGQPQGSGMGSRIMGGLATGAALGAGLVAGEAIARQFTGGSHGDSSGNHDQPRNDIVYDNPDELLRRDDMGGNNFGVSDGGWDDSGGGGGDSGGGGGDWD
ncbi:tetratricopeptide repeat protein [Duganella aceris]|uniref:Tetratricopeptide repeat protein n=1 Tax=Duganella aceris TaxID=2703883 RepID=A0ABX0FP00_9BURK|nr:tetratricopeptide repeat protein [Duganella aceris]NGZ86367.1 tetratricopeptide repeat protein [Duganella aceris]